METRDRKQSRRIRRVRPAGVTALELWDLWAGDRILWDRMEQPDFGTVLLHAMATLQRGDGVTRSEGPVPPGIAGFTSIHLSGGKAGAVAESLRKGPWTLSLGDDVEHPSKSGGLALLERAGLTGWVVDLGQSALKICNRDRAMRWERDLSKLPVRTDCDDEDVEAQRAELRYFIDGALIRFRKETGAEPEGLVVALPSRLDDAGVPEGSSYTGMAGDSQLMGDVMQGAGMNEAEVLLLNDAELAAVSAVVENKRDGKTLVLTLGFGVGAALLE